MSSVRARLYNANGHDDDIELSATTAKSLTKSQLLWIDGPIDDLRKAKFLPSDIKKVLDVDPGGAALEILDPVYRFTVPTLSENAKGKSHPLTFIVGKAGLVTVSEPRPAFFDRFVDTDRGETLNGRMTPSALTVALLTELFDTYRAELSRIDKQIDKLDDEILRSREKKVPFDTLATLRRQVSVLRAALDETGDAVHALTRPDFFAHIDAADHGFFEGLARTHERLLDSIARARETIIGSFDLYTTRVAQDTNRLVKALTITTVMTGIIGAVAGIFGMNFDTPFEHTGIIGFLDVTAVMVATSLGIVCIAIWRKWF